VGQKSGKGNIKRTCNCATCDLKFQILEVALVAKSAGAKLTQLGANACILRSILLAATQNRSRTGIEATQRMTRLRPASPGLFSIDHETRGKRSREVTWLKGCYAYQKDITPSGSNIYSLWQCAYAYAPPQTPESRQTQRTVSGCKWVLKSIEFQLYSMFNILEHMTRTFI
jgi:hypothetical protein